MGKIIRSIIRSIARASLGCVLLLLIIGTQPVWAANSLSNSKIMLSHDRYHGWEDAWILSNGQVEVVVVPAIARIMQFRFQNPDLEQPFWENRQLDGQIADKNSQEWSNFGGDKAWIAPQSDWGKMANRDWPPPITFDATAARVEVEKEGITLISEIDPFYGLQYQRRIVLDPERPVMGITTTFHQVQKSLASDKAIWIVTQLNDPVEIQAPVNRIVPLAASLPPSLQVERGLLSLKRDRDKDYKIGCDADTLLWMGKEISLEISTPQIIGSHYPDRDSSAEIYTNPDPHQYVELEFLSPLAKLELGESIKQTITYTLMLRRNADTK